MRVYVSIIRDRTRDDDECARVYIYTAGLFLIYDVECGVRELFGLCFAKLRPALLTMMVK